MRTPRLGGEILIAAFAVLGLSRSNLRDFMLQPIGLSTSKIFRYCGTFSLDRPSAAIFAIVCSKAP